MVELLKQILRFIRNTLLYGFEFSCSCLPNELRTSTQLQTYKVGRKRSLVRRMGWIFKMKPAPRVNLTDQVYKLLVCGSQSPPLAKQSQIWSSEARSSNKPDVVVRVSSDSCLDRLTTLEQEVTNLKSLLKQVILELSEFAYYLRRLQRQFVPRGHQTVITVRRKLSTNLGAAAVSLEPAKMSERLGKTKCVEIHKGKGHADLPSALPPPPPPPPPPLPPPSLASSLPIISSKNNTSHERKDPHSDMNFNLGEILKDLHKVKLRPIEKTASGSPIRHQPLTSEPTSVLTAVLRKRYAAIQTRTPERRNYDNGDDSEFDDYVFNT